MADGTKIRKVAEIEIKQKSKKWVCRLKSGS